MLHLTSPSLPSLRALLFLLAPSGQLCLLIVLKPPFSHRFCSYLATSLDVKTILDNFRPLLRSELSILRVHVGVCMHVCVFLLETTTYTLTFPGRCKIIGIF